MKKQLDKIMEFIESEITQYEIWHDEPNNSDQDRKMFKNMLNTLKDIQDMLE